MFAKEAWVKFHGMLMDPINWLFHMQFLVSNKLPIKWRPTHMFGIYKTQMHPKFPLTLLHQLLIYHLTINWLILSEEDVQMVSLVFGIIVKGESQLLLLMLKNLIMIQLPTSNGKWQKLVLNVFQFLLTVSLISGIPVNSRKIVFNHSKSLILILMVRKLLLEQPLLKTVPKQQVNLW
jgi:hypothetical protein